MFCDGRASPKPFGPDHKSSGRTCLPELLYSCESLPRSTVGAGVVLLLPCWLNVGEPAFGCLITFPYGPAYSNAGLSVGSARTSSCCAKAHQRRDCIEAGTPHSLLVSLTRPFPRAHPGAKMKPGPRRRRAWSDEQLEASSWGDD